MNNTTKAIVYGGLLMAMKILLTYVFAFQTQFIRIDFAFIPLAIYAMMWGPFNAMLMAAMADIIGTNLFMPGMYFPGFTLSALLTGYIYGHFLYRRPIALKNFFYAAGLTFLLVDCILNNIWLTIMYHDAAKAFFSIRVVKSLILVPIKAYILYKLTSSLSFVINKAKDGVVYKG